MVFLKFFLVEIPQIENKKEFLKSGRPPLGLADELSGPFFFVGSLFLRIVVESSRSTIKDVVMTIIPDSDDVNPGLTKPFSKEEKDQTANETTEPFDPEDHSTDTDVDDYKDMQIEMHRFYSRQKSMYKWDNIK